MSVVNKIEIFCWVESLLKTYIALLWFSAFPEYDGLSLLGLLIEKYLQQHFEADEAF